MIVKAQEYHDVDDLWRDAVIACLDSGTRYQAINQRPTQSSRAGDVYGEVLGFHTVLQAKQQRTFLRNPIRRMDPAYCCAEVLWCFSGTDRTTPLLRYAPSYQEKYGEPDETAYGAYGARVMPKFSGVLSLLKTHENTRQAVVLTWKDEDFHAVLGQSKKDIPCLISWQFLVRDGQLHMVTYMRSNDVWLGMPCDIFAFTCFQRVLACELGLNIGLYHHFVGTLHLYDRYADKAKKAVLHQPVAAYEQHGWKLDTTRSDLDLAIMFEQELRLKDSEGGFDIERLKALSSMSYDLVATCTQRLKICPGGVQTPVSPRLRCTY